MNNAETKWIVTKDLVNAYDYKVPYAQSALVLTSVRYSMEW